MGREVACKFCYKWCSLRAAVVPGVRPHARSPVSFLSCFSGLGAWQEACLPLTGTAVVTDMSRSPQSQHRKASPCLPASLIQFDLVYIKHLRVECSGLGAGVLGTQSLCGPGP